MIEKKAETSVNINELLARRWSGRAYDPDRKISQADIHSLLEAARWAPSCFGDEPWRFIVCDKTTNSAAWEKAFQCLMEGNQSWAKDAPLLMLGVGDTLLSKNGKPNRWGEFDTGAASMSLCVQATELGLMVHQMGGYDANKARETFNIPEQFTTMSMIAVGYQLPLEQLTIEQKERELSDRNRSQLGDKFFNGDWGNSISFDN